MFEPSHIISPSASPSMDGFEGGEAEYDCRVMCKSEAVPQTMVTESLEGLTTERGMLDTCAVTEPDHYLKQMPWYKKEALLRVRLADSVEINPSYKTLFDGLKKNHPHNAAAVYPVLYLTRRILYALTIIFLTSQPYFSAISLMLTCLFMLCFVMQEE